MSASGQPTVDDLFRVVRGRILSCQLAPGTTISQVQLAEALNVNRASLREALRMLQREGLIEGEYNRRVRVAPLSSHDLEQIYALRITQETLAIRVAVPRMTPADLDEIDRLLAELRSAKAEGRGDDVEALHREFHDRLVRHAGERIAASIGELADYSARYRRALSAMRSPSTFTLADQEHAELATACREGDADRAAHTLARHYARAALSLGSISNPAHDPVSVREALRTVMRSVEHAV